MSQTPYCQATSFPSVTTVPTLITSPNYPLPYLSETSCDYYIKKHPLYASARFVLYLTFVSTDFMLPGKMINCDEEYLEISVGDSSSVQSVSKFCGNVKPFDIYSVGGRIQMKLRTRQETTGGTFKAYVYLKDAAGQNCTSLPTTDSESGIIHSPSYPLGYYSGDNCDVKITLPDGSTNIRLILMDITLQQSFTNTCDENDQDYFEIRGTNYITGEFDESKPLEQIPGKQCKTTRSIFHVTTTLRYILIRFRAYHTSYKADGSGLARGFYMGYVIYSIVDPYEEILWWLFIIIVVFIFFIIMCLIYLHYYLEKKHKKINKIQVKTAASSPSEQALQGSSKDSSEHQSPRKDDSKHELKNAENEDDISLKNKEEVPKLVIGHSKWVENEYESLESLQSDGHYLKTQRSEDSYTVRTMETELYLTARSLHLRRHSYEAAELAITQLDEPEPEPESDIGVLEDNTENKT